MQDMTLGIVYKVYQKGGMAKKKLFKLTMYIFLLINKDALLRSLAKNKGHFRKTNHLS